VLRAALLVAPQGAGSTAGPEPRNTVLFTRVTAAPYSSSVIHRIHRGLEVKIRTKDMRARTFLRQLSCGICSGFIHTCELSLPCCCAACHGGDRVISSTAQPLYHSFPIIFSSWFPKVTSDITLGGAAVRPTRRGAPAVLLSELYRHARCLLLVASCSESSRRA
jgi:hypothetical protein